MFIGIAGSQCSGKHAVAEYLINRHAFKYVMLENTECPIAGAQTFTTLDDMQLHVTQHWRDNFVTCDIDGRFLWLFKKRPFFLLASIEAPISLRYQRKVERSRQRNQDTPSLEEFIQKDDELMFDALEGKGATSIPMYTVMSMSDVTIANTHQNIDQLYQALQDLDLTNYERLRPSWDTYFMHLSDLAARRSNCMKRRVGCILVKDSRVIATGYNGTPRGIKNCNDGGCERCNDGTPCGVGLDRCLCMHAEENALLEAGRGNGVILYCNTCPCLGCATKIIQQGIKEVVYSASYGMDDMTKKIFTDANVVLRQHSPPSMRLEMQADMADIIQEQLAWKEAVSTEEEQRKL